jgi:hypothetical protein
MLSSLPVAHVAHAGERRTRLRIPGHQGDSEFFSACAARLTEIPGVLAVRPRSLTASLLVEHERPFAAVAEDALNAGLFTVKQEPAAGEPLAAIPPVAAVLGALAVVQLFRASVLPPAITLGWYAWTLMLERQVLKPSASSVPSQGSSRSRRPT